MATDSKSGFGQRGRKRLARLKRDETASQALSDSHMAG
jgi:hypothetical protein